MPARTLDGAGQQQRPQRRRYAQHHAAARHVFAHPHLFLEQRDFAGDALAVIEKLHTCRSQPNPSRMSHQQRHANLRFEQTHLPAERRLRDTELIGRQAHTAGVGNPHEITNAA